MTGLRYVVLATVVISTAYIGACEETKFKRELPLSLNCNPLAGTCYKGDLIDESIADCERDSFFLTCDPSNDIFLSSVVDIPDNCFFCADCEPVNRALRCGATGTDTRCVCDKAIDLARPKETLANHCRCQYWPQVDIRSNQPSYCSQFDHGGTSGVHFYTCCNNCNDPGDKSCGGTAYQGGGATRNDYCSGCGANSGVGGGRVTYRYSCGSCSQQTVCKAKCDNAWNGIVSAFPGLCWKWSECFRACCVESQNLRRKRETNDVIDPDEFCGDAVCQEGEDRTICPIDCCPNHNPTTDCGA